jgi:hypothetical protein
MISLEQIRLLETKITRAMDLIRVLKEENGTLRRGLESAQKRMKELEILVDGFKSDQKEIETVILRTLHNLDELEESVHTPRKPDPAGAPSASAATHAAPASASVSPVASASASPAGSASASPAGSASAGTASSTAKPPDGGEDEPGPAKEELDIF